MHISSILLRKYQRWARMLLHTPTHRKSILLRDFPFLQFCSPSVILFDGVREKLLATDSLQP